MTCSACGYARNADNDLVCAMCRAPLAPGANQPVRKEPASPGAAKPTASPLKCVSCGRNIARGLPRCPVCGAGAPGVKADRRADGMVEGITELARGIVQESVAGRRRDRRARLIDAGLFLLMSPISAPSVVLTYLQAKRWGRIPFVMIVFDVIVLLALSGPLGLLFGFTTAEAGRFFFGSMVVAAFAFMVLAMRRAMAQKLETGIFLGYSNGTLLPLVAGGILLALGAGRIASAGPTAEERRLLISAEAERMSAAEALSADLSRGIPHVVLADGSVQTERAVWRVERGGGGFFAVDPGAATPAGPDDLLLRPEDWRGTCVELRARLRSDDGFWLDEDWRETPEFTRMSAAAPGRIYSEVRTKDRGALWLVSPRFPSYDSPAAGAHRSAQDGPWIGHVIAVDPAALKRIGFSGAPREPLGVLCTPPPAPGEIARCAPVDGTGYRLWVAWRGEAPPSPVRGILEEPGEVERDLLATVIRAKHEPGFAGAVRVLTAAEPQEYRTLRGLGDPPAPRAAGGAAWGMLFGGLLALAGAGWLAARE